MPPRARAHAHNERPAPAPRGITSSGKRRAEDPPCRHQPHVAATAAAASTATHAATRAAATATAAAPPPAAAVPLPPPLPPPPPLPLPPPQSSARAEATPGGVVDAASAAAVAAAARAACSVARVGARAHPNAQFPVSRRLAVSCRGFMDVAGRGGSGSGALGGVQRQQTPADSAEKRRRHKNAVAERTPRTAAVRWWLARFRM